MTLDGQLLECVRHQGHQGLHFDGDWRLWWAREDTRAVGAGGLTITGDSTGALAGLADAVGGFAEDIGCGGDERSAYASDLLERLAARISEHAAETEAPQQPAAVAADPLRRLAGIITGVIGPMHPSNGTDALQAIARAIQAGE